MHSLHLLRGILATWVIFFHTDSTRFPVMDYMPFRSKGYLAVDIFFILSGFMLAHNYR
jgi:peptidoglycan/LPS O-acetylase OafA/YrhL